jgi:tetratricopeptide (TPR) repeat protein
MMSQTADSVPARTKLKVALGNLLQKYRGVLLVTIAVLLVVVAAVAIWTQIDAASKNAFAVKIEKSQTDYGTWMLEADDKKAEAGKTLEADLADIEKSAPVGYGLAKAWFLDGNYLATQKKWPDASNAFRKAYEADPSSYLAPIALVNSAVAQEQAGSVDAALKAYAEFEKTFASDAVLAPQVFFTEGRLLESQSKTDDALAAYKKLLQKFPESNWTKLGRDRILLLGKD